MIQEIKMPSAGQTTDEAKIYEIHVKVGDTVQRGDVLMEAETDKAYISPAELPPPLLIRLSPLLLSRAGWVRRSKCRVPDKPQMKPRFTASA